MNGKIETNEERIIRLYNTKKLSPHPVYSEASGGKDETVKKDDIDYDHQPISQIIDGVFVYKIAVGGLLNSKSFIRYGVQSKFAEEGEITLKDMLAKVQGATDLYVVRKWKTVTSVAFVGNRELKMLYVFRKHRERLHGLETLNYLIDKKLVDTVNCRRWDVKALKLFMGFNFVPEALNRDGMMTLRLYDEKIIAKKRGY